MIKFIKKLLSDNDDVSSKRFIGVLSFIFLLVAGIVNLCGGTILNGDFIAAFSSIIGATLLGNVIEKLNKQSDQSTETTDDV